MTPSETGAPQVPSPGPPNQSQAAPPGSPNPATLTQSDYLAGIIGSLKAEALLMTENSLLAFSNALAYGPTPKPTGYFTTSVNVPLVTALFNGTDQNPGDWNNVFIQTWFVPPPAPVAPIVFPQGYPVGPETKPGSGIYVALDVGNLPQFPDGSQWTVMAAVPGGAPAGGYTKRMNPTPFGDEPYWKGLPS